MNDYKFSKLNKSHLVTLVKWAEEEGWNPGPGDADVYWATDKDGYYGYFDDGELIAGGSTVSYDSAFGFMGFFIVKPEYRSKGIGKKLWFQRREMMLARLKKGAAIGMDGVVDMQKFYNKGGFEIAFRDERYEIDSKEYDYVSKISPVTESDYEQIIEYDAMYFGLSRPQFLKPWMEVDTTNAFKYIDNGSIQGYIIIRKAFTGYKVCPLFAENEYIAEELLKAALNLVAGEPLYLDIPVINARAKALIEKYKGKYIFECARMYYGKPPEVDINKIFGITTFELG